MAISIYSIRRILHRDPNKLRERSEGPRFWWSDANDLPGWPKPAITDSEGRFTIHGIGRDLSVSLAIHHPRYALQQIEIETDKTSESKEVSLALQPAQIITGRVTYADTGKPASHATLTVMANKDGRSTPTSFQTDGEGRFRASPSPGDQFVVRANPPEGQPYLVVSQRFDWPKGAVEHSLDLALSRGVLIRGKVVEKGSGIPVAGASVTFHSPSKSSSTRMNSNPRAKTADDGSFQLAVQPGHGHLAINAPGDDFVLQPIGEDLLVEGKPGGRRRYSSAFVACDPKLGQHELQVDVELRRGITVSGRVIGPDGHPVQDTWMISRLMLNPSGGAEPYLVGRRARQCAQRPL